MLNEGYERTKLFDAVCGHRTFQISYPKYRGKIPIRRISSASDYILVILNGYK